MHVQTVTAPERLFPVNPKKGKYIYPVGQAVGAGERPGLKECCCGGGNTVLCSLGYKVCSVLEQYTTLCDLCSLCSVGSSVLKQNSV